LGFDLLGRDVGSAGLEIPRAMDVERIVFCGPSIGAHKESRREQVQSSLQTFAWSSADFLDLHDIFDLAIARPKADKTLTDVVRRIDHVLKVAALSVV